MKFWVVKCQLRESTCRNIYFPLCLQIRSLLASAHWCLLNRSNLVTESWECWVLAALSFIGAAFEAPTTLLLDRVPNEFKDAPDEQSHRNYNTPNEVEESNDCAIDRFTAGSNVIAARFARCWLVWTTSCRWGCTSSSSRHILLLLL